MQRVGACGSMVSGCVACGMWHVACAGQRGHLERRAVRAEQPVAPLDEALLVAAQPSYLDDVARDLVLVENLPRLGSGGEGEARGESEDEGGGESEGEGRGGGRRASARVRAKVGRPSRESSDPSAPAGDGRSERAA